MIVYIITSLVLLVWVVISIDIYLGMRSVPQLGNYDTAEDGPLLSIIVPARNEASTIQSSIETQLEQTYQNVEWILVNDRSVDDTGVIMEKLKQKDDRINVIHVEKLAEGWLGKNHAMYKGYQHSKGDILLFTDADVHYKDPTILSKAIGVFAKEKIAHVTLAPSIEAKSFWLRSFVAFFLFGFNYYKRPWKANDPSSKTGMGIGAFNMITKASYENIGTHKAIRYRPDDDLQLGYLVKKYRLTQRFITALPFLSVEWYPSLVEAFKGLEKNTFAGFYYRYSMVIFAVVGLFISHILPFILLFYPNHHVQLLSALTVTAIFIAYYVSVKTMTRYRTYLFFAFPITALLFIISILRAIYITVRSGGIQWRGTTYPLKELRRRQGK